LVGKVMTVIRKTGMGIAALAVLAFFCAAPRIGAGETAAEAWIRTTRANPQFRDVQAKGQTLAHYAAGSGRVDVLGYLRARGVNIHARDNRGQHPIHFAAHSGHTEAMQWLLANGTNVNARNSDGWTSAHIAARNGNVAVLQWLAARGADMGARDQNGRIPLQFAEASGQRNAAAWLREGSGGTRPPQPVPMPMPMPTPTPAPIPRSTRMCRGCDGTGWVKNPGRRCYACQGSGRLQM
jgi:hypothetical protein